MDFDPYVNLANAIVASAARDYRMVIRSLKNNPRNWEAQQEEKKLEEFFRSGWFEFLTDLDGEALMAEIRKMEGKVVV